MQATVQTIYELIDDIAPFDSQEGFDNAGLLVGNRNQPVQRVLLALDVTASVIDEAKRLQAQLIVTHHPVMFRGTKSLLNEDYEGGVISHLICSDLALISAHTNLDQSSLGAGLLIADMLGMTELLQADHYVVVGLLPEPATAEKIGRRIAGALGGSIRVFGENDKLITRLGIAGGAYDEGYLTARAHGADAFLTGEVRHHNALAAAESGFVLYDGGHYQTEAPMMHALGECLQSKLNALQCDVEVYVATAPALSAGYALEEET